MPFTATFPPVSEERKGALRPPSLGNVEEPRSTESSNEEVLLLELDAWLDTMEEYPSPRPREELEMTDAEQPLQTSALQRPSETQAEAESVEEESVTENPKETHKSSAKKLQRGRRAKNKLLPRGRGDADAGVQAVSEELGAEGQDTTRSDLHLQRKCKGNCRRDDKPGSKKQKRRAARKKRRVEKKKRKAASLEGRLLSPRHTETLEAVEHAKMKRKDWERAARAVTGTARLTENPSPEKSFLERVSMWLSAK